MRKMSFFKVVALLFVSFLCSAKAYCQDPKEALQYLPLATAQTTNMDTADPNPDPDGNSMFSDNPGEPNSPFLPFTCSESHPENTIGLKLCTEGAMNGFTLFSTMGSKYTTLIDKFGNLVHYWKGQGPPALSVHLMPDGNLVRTEKILINSKFNQFGGEGGHVTIQDWDGNLIWDFVYIGPDHFPHHDIEVLPNGNILILAWKSYTSEEAILSGRSPQSVSVEGMFATQIVEVVPTGPDSGEIVWEWNLWDHLIQDQNPLFENYGAVDQHPERVDINYGFHPLPDWTHANAIHYEPDFDQIVISVRHFCEFWVIDHSTTTLEASGHTGGYYGKGGDLLYRWGNPEAYDRGNGPDRRLFFQHDSKWIEKKKPGWGNILVFNNQHFEPPDTYFSSVDEIAPPVNPDGSYKLTEGEPYGPENLIWTYTGDGFYSAYISGAQRLENGNTLICQGSSGRLFEVTQDHEIVWEYINPFTHFGHLNPGEEAYGNAVFRAELYPPDFEAFRGKDLTPKEWPEE